MKSHQFILVCLILGLFTACDQDQNLVTELTETSFADDYEVAEVGVDADLNDDPFTCAEWALFCREDDNYEFRMSCYPFFNFDSVFTKRRIAMVEAKRVRSIINGTCTYTVASRPLGMTHSSAEEQGVLNAYSYDAPFYAQDVNQDGFWDISIEFESSTINLSGATIQITNSTELGGKLYRCQLAYTQAGYVHDIVVYWESRP
jgi:hypothetical protein